LLRAVATSTLVILPDTAHGGEAFESPAVADQVRAFFDRHLR
jgi:hypothetical protein